MSRSELVKVGTIIKNKYTDDILQIVENDYQGRIPVYHAKWINYDGSLSEGTLKIFGSQIFDYKELPATDCEESIFDQAIAVLQG